jgi:hypothetical protein
MTKHLSHCGQGSYLGMRNRTPMRHGIPCLLELEHPALQAR